jgi:hypothetical protein
LAHATQTQEKLTLHDHYSDSFTRSHFTAMKPSLRQEFASYISQQSASAGYKTLVPANLQKASNLAVANL